MIKTGKILLQLIGIAILLAIFGLVYLWAMSLKPVSDPALFSEDTKEIGQLGGYHYLVDAEFIEADEFWRIAFVTTLNRVSPISETIGTPHVKVAQKTTSSFPLLAPDLTDLGSHYLLLNFSDTSIYDQESSPPLRLFSGDDIQPINQSNINELRLNKPDNDSDYQVFVGVDGPVEFRLQENPEDTGIVWLDILK